MCYLSLKQLIIVCLCMIIIDEIHASGRSDKGRYFHFQCDERVVKIVINNGE